MLKRIRNKDIEARQVLLIWPGTVTYIINTQLSVFDVHLCRFESTTFNREYFHITKEVKKSFSFFIISWIFIRFLVDFSTIIIVIPIIALIFVRVLTKFIWAMDLKIRLKDFFESYLLMINFDQHHNSVCIYVLIHMDKGHYVQPQHSC